jgi:hypothetical protein
MTARPNGIINMGVGVTTVKVGGITHFTQHLSGGSKDDVSTTSAVVVSVDIASPVRRGGVSVGGTVIIGPTSFAGVIAVSEISCKAQRGSPPAQ